MLRFFSAFILLVFLTNDGFAEQKPADFNPIFRDSVLNSKLDTVLWNTFLHKVDIHQASIKRIIRQPQKTPLNSIFFLYMAFAVLLLVVFFKLVFDDFSYALLEGILSHKKFYFYVQSKKYDSFIAVFVLYILKITLLSMIVYAGVHFSLKENFSSVNKLIFWKIVILLFLFFTIKNLLELAFNSLLNMQHSFKSFFLQNLFIEFFLFLLIMILLLVYIYNNNISIVLMKYMFLIGLISYSLFNIVRSYQLLSVTRIAYKLHFFLYICTFKILPVLVLAKYILKNLVVI